ncbi:DNA-binding protein [Okeania sp. SIO3I5]|uniref:DNA-binding protein n=1 Tax=Okeania sp. SIO3I5 TaxID=2607805 RepID=UPI0025CCC3A3|nr:DNA-binding protein [Okeania sp. SIO3I5]
MESMEAIETIETVGTTEAAFLLNISTGRLRVLLGQGRIKDARRGKHFWKIPLNSRGMPEVIPGRRGPEGTWNKGQRTGNTFIHVLRKEIDYNRDHGTSHPAISVKQGNRNDRCHEAEIKGHCKIVYRPHTPNRSQAGGARLWIEVEPDVEIVRKFFRNTELGEDELLNPDLPEFNLVTTIQTTPPLKETSVSKVT